MIAREVRCRKGLYAGADCQQAVAQTETTRANLDAVTAALVYDLLPNELGIPVCGRVCGV